MNKVYRKIKLDKIFKNFNSKNKSVKKFLKFLNKSRQLLSNQTLNKRNLYNLQVKIKTKMIKN